MAFSPKDALQYLRRAHEQNRLGHAYLISGPVGSGKRTVAAELASLVNGTEVENIFSTKARGVVIAEPESKSRRIVIEQVRNLEHMLRLQSAQGRKVAIISEADRLQPQAANAFLKTLEEPPSNSLLLLLSAMPEVLPDTILSRCISIPLAVDREKKISGANAEFVELLKGAAGEQTWNVQLAYRLAQGLHRLLGTIRAQIKDENEEAMKREETHYRNSTDGTWLEEREDYYKALTESLYLRRRAELIEILFVWWSDILRANTGVERRDLMMAKKEVEIIAKRFTTAEILRRIRRLEELRDHLGRNIQEALAVEVAFLRIFGA